MKRLLLIAALASGCASHLSTGPDAVLPVTQTAPASIRLTLSSRADRTYDVTATVLTADGHFVKDVALTFALDGGNVTPEHAITNINGMAQAVASAASSTTLTVTAGDLTASTHVDGVPSTLILYGLSMTAGETASFTVIGFVSGTSPTVATSWTFGDGGTAVSANASTSHRYPRAGSFTTTVMATDAQGRSGSTSALVSVSAAPPPPAPPPPAPPVPPSALSASVTCTPAAHVPTPPTPPGSPTFCNVSATYGGAIVPASTITESRWDWGDGTALDVQTTSPTIPLGAHSYQRVGTYTLIVEISATTADGVKFARTTLTLVIP